MMDISSKSHVDECGNLYFDVTVKKNGAVMEKRIEAEAYCKMIAGNLKPQEHFVNVPHLPKEVLICRVSTGKESSFDAVVLFPAKKRAFSYFGRHYFLPFPALIAKVNVRDGRRTGMEMFALPTDEPTDETPLFQYPFGNVYEDGSCCFGNILVEGLTGAAQAPEVLETFLSSITDNDLYHAQNTKRYSQTELIQEIEGKDVFPTELLLAVTNQTVGSFKQFK